MLNIQYYIDAFFSSYFGGTIILIFGIFRTYKSWKNNEKTSDSILQPHIKGWLAGIFSIALGLFIIINKILGRL